MILYIVNSGVMSSLFDNHGPCSVWNRYAGIRHFPAIHVVSVLLGAGLEERIEGNKNSGNAPFLFKMAAAAFTAAARHEYSYIYAERNNRCTNDRICHPICHYCISPVLF